MLVGCDGGGGGGGAFEITACAPLGCSTPGGVQVSCGVTDIAVNQELRIAFSQPVDLSSVNNNTFRVQDPQGLTPPGEFLLDANDPSILIYRPQLSFDSSGNPIFGLTQNSSYTIFIPGRQLDSGPYIRSSNGALNSKRLFCTLSTPFSPIDLNPGPPAVDTRVDVVATYDSNGDPETFDLDVPALGAVNVFRTSPIRFTFSDVMNPGTLVNPVTGGSSSLSVFVDGDGSTSTTSDQVPIEGTFSLSINTQALTTTVVFTPALGYPSAGNDPSAPRRIVVTLGATIADLGGNALVNSGILTFVPESVVFPPVSLTENFNGNGSADLLSTGAFWSAPNGLGGLTLQPGVGGGSGVHGDINVPAGVTVLLNTDSEDFSGITDLTIYNPATQVRDPLTQAPLVATGGIFEFASVTIASGGTLRFEGSNPARVFVRGQCRVQGTLNVAGANALDHDGLPCDGGAGGIPGPGGGAGGQGGDRPPTANFQNVPGLGDIVTPQAPVPACNPVLYSDVNGKPGVGIPIPNSLTPIDSVGEGGGGLAWPQPVTPENFDFPVNSNDVSEAEDLGLYSVTFGCGIKAPGSPGGGGAHGLSGQVADLRQAGGQPAAAPPEAPGGDRVAIGIGPDERTLDPLQGYLRGGAGGGGGGGHLQDTRINGFAFINCFVTIDGFPTVRIIEYVASSSAGGGGGGGALQLQAGRSVTVSGVIDASGGNGGSGIAVSVGLNESPPSAMGGGGGAGGAVLLQSQAVDVANQAGRIDITGGEGGQTNSAAFSRGGLGGAGLLRIETIPVRPTSDYAPIDCTGGVVGCNPANFGNSPVFPDPDDLLNPFELPVGDIADLFTTAEWQSSATGVGRVSGAMSCWLQPDGNFFVLDFVEDEVDGGGAITNPGWDMLVQVAGAPAPVSYRLPGALFQGASVEDLAALLPFPPVSVRFQGARTLEPLDSPCDVPLAGAESPIFPGSVSGWVEHPAELDDFFAGDPTRRPNMFRFMIVFDTRDPVVSSVFQGVDDVTIQVRPD